MKKEILDKYKEEEYKRDFFPYSNYFKALEETIDFTLTSSFADFGCNNGRLLEAIKKKHPKVNLLGLDYFEWAKQYAPDSIRDNIKIADLAKPLESVQRYDIVNCSEVGEHIPRESEDIFIDNLVNSTGDILIITWSAKNDVGGQHLNPRSKSYLKKKFQDRGFIYWKESSKDLSSVLKDKLEGVGYNWWAKDIMVFKRIKFLKIDSSYLIQNISTDNGSHAVNFVKKGLSKQYLQKSFLNLISIINEKTSANKSYSILRLGDGDYFLLRKIGIGSAKPGNRSLTRSFRDVNIDLFKQMIWHNDTISISLEKNDHRSWKKFIMVDFFEKIYSKIFSRSILINNTKIFRVIDLVLSALTVWGVLPTLCAWFYGFKKGKIYFNKARKIINKQYLPLEVVYALISTKWIFKNFKNQVGLIASAEKLSIIKELIKKDEYKAYLGIDQFTDFVEIPSKGAADDAVNLAHQIGERISKSQAKIFLVGAGSAKILLLPILKHYSNAVFIDVGAGIDALAGIVSQDRPYFSDWTNYRIKRYDYSNVDFMDKNNPARFDTKYLTVELN